MLETETRGKGDPTVEGLTRTIRGQVDRRKTKDRYGTNNWNQKGYHKGQKGGSFLSKELKMLSKRGRLSGVEGKKKRAPGRRGSNGEILNGQWEGGENP